MSKTPLDYKPDEIDLNKMYYDTIKYFINAYKTVPTAADKKYIILILKNLMYKQKDSIKILNNNLHNIKPISDRNVYIIMQQHSMYPAYIYPYSQWQIYDPKTNKSVPEDKMGTQYIKKLPNNVTMIDLFGAGSLTKCNLAYETIFRRGNYNELLKGNLNDFIKEEDIIRDSDIINKERYNRLMKFIQKNGKIYYPGDYYINFFNIFEKKSNRNQDWEFFVKEPYDLFFHRITNKSRNIKLKQFAQFQDNYRT